MGADHGHGVPGLPFLPDGEGDDGRRISRQVVLPTGLESTGPVFTLFDICKISILETGYDRSDSMVSYVDGIDDDVSAWAPKGGGGVLGFGMRNNGEKKKTVGTSLRVGEALTKSRKSRVAGPGGAMVPDENSRVTLGPS